MTAADELGPTRVGFTEVAPGEWDELPVERRILLAYVKCVGRWGMSKTTMSDVAAEAGCGRATVYRLVPGGVDGLEQAARLDQAEALTDLVVSALDPTADVADLLTEAIHAAALAMARNETLQYLLRHEPEALEPHLTLHSLEPIVDAARRRFVPLLEGRPGLSDPDRLVEHLVRVLMSYVQSPSNRVDLTNRDDVEHLLATYVLPGHTDQAARTFASATAESATDH